MRWLNVRLIKYIYNFFMIVDVRDTEHRDPYDNDRTAKQPYEFSIEFQIGNG